MTLDEKSMAALLDTYVVETEEGLTAAEQALLDLEREPEDAEAVARVFRVVHTIKGNAGLFEFSAVSTLSHEMEDLLDRLRRGTTAVTAPLVTLLLRSLDSLRTLVRDSITRPRELVASEKALIGALKAAGAGRSAAKNGRHKRLRADPAKAASLSTLPVDDTRSRPQEAQVVPRELNRTLRVDVTRLDRLLDLSGEIGIARGRVSQLLEDPLTPRKALLEAHRDAIQLHAEMQELIMKLRMVPVGPTFRQLLRIVRDTAGTLGKVAELSIEGEDVEVDMSVVEQLKDPLMHMIRNSIDHGIELPDARLAAGKTECGRLHLRSFHEAGSIVIELEDDGAGLDRDMIARRARKQGLISDEGSLSDPEIFELLFQPGFSTSEQVSDVSGRGVGLDVVRRNIESIHGTVRIDSTPGKGTTARVRLPLTLAVIEGLQVGIAGEAYIIPMQAVVEVLDLRSDPMYVGETTGLLAWRGEDIPFIRLRDRLKFHRRSESSGREHAVVVRWGERGRAALVVDALRGECQTVVKPLARMLQGLSGISGSGILTNGRIAFIVDVPGLLESESRPTRGQRDDASAAAYRTISTVQAPSQTV